MPCMHTHTAQSDLRSWAPGTHRGLPQDRSEGTLGTSKWQCSLDTSTASVSAGKPSPAPWRSAASAEASSPHTGWDPVVRLERVPQKPRKVSNCTLGHTLKIFLGFRSSLGPNLSPGDLKWFGSRLRRVKKVQERAQFPPPLISHPLKKPQLL